MSITWSKMCIPAAALSLAVRCAPVAMGAPGDASAPAAGSPPHVPGGPEVEKSMPSSAPAATTTRTTGATDQSPTVKAMNSNEKAKVENSGK
jgi:hypothetical protein